MKYTLKNGCKVILRDAQISDAKNLVEYMRKINAESKNLMREPDEFKFTIKQEEKFIQMALDSPNACFMVVLDDNLVISTAEFQGNNLRRVNHRVSLGISVLEDYQNLGLGRIVMEALIKRAIELQKTKMDLEVRIDNLSAIHLYESLGFEKEGIIRNGFFVDNNYIDLLVMGKLL